MGNRFKGELNPGGTNSTQPSDIGGANSSWRIRMTYWPWPEPQPSSRRPADDAANKTLGG